MFFYKLRKSKVNCRSHTQSRSFTSVLRGRVKQHLVAGVRGRGEWVNSGALICDKRVREKGGRLTSSSARRTSPCLRARFSPFLPL